MNRHSGTAYICPFRSLQVPPVNSRGPDMHDFAMRQFLRRFCAKPVRENHMSCSLDFRSPDHSKTGDVRHRSVDSAKDQVAE